MNLFAAREILNGPLRFGDVDQINALRVMYPPEQDGKKQYRVDVTITHTETVFVFAEDEDEAEDLARDEIDFADIDFDFHVKELADGQ